MKRETLIDYNILKQSNLPKLSNGTIHFRDTTYFCVSVDTYHDRIE
jgi:hypothetical protein